ncbi:hypothetical protein D1007_05135 [Hordeum vulgare]|nr:hypothetical protein D1007_05135 [Hordeum vulgare]
MMGLIKELREVESHGNTKLQVTHTNDLHKVENTIKHYEQHLKKTKPVLLFQLSTTEDKCMLFDNFGYDTRYTFVGFCIDGDIEKLDRVGLKIGHFMDILKEFRVPESTKCMDSLGDVSNILIDYYYTYMKHKMMDEDHGRWAKMPLSERHI